ncbi:MAG: D-glycero-beta-D-manno-heptose 1,7-bisphosphate 7-phosphatase, partial [bacterium]
MNQRLIILDRDGVINRLLPNGVATPDEWEALDGSLEAIAQLCRADCRVVIITNQSGIAKGRCSINALNRIHRKMLDALQPIGGEISAIFFCPHIDDDDCDCRKPKSGLFLELADRLKCDLREAYAVGDSLRDLQAAQRVGDKPVLVRTGNGADTAALLPGAQTPPEIA